MIDRKKLIEDLQKTPDMVPDEHDGSYELMREVVKAYAKTTSYSVYYTPTYRDMDAIYHSALGTWKSNPEKKKEKIHESYLPESEKIRLDKVIDSIWDKACKRQYINKEYPDKPSFGMFGTGFMSFKRSISDRAVQDFIKMISDISKIDDGDEEAIFSRCEKVFNKGVNGLGAASASVILHCLKPTVFPILNANGGNGNIYEPLGINLNKSNQIETYIQNCRKISAFRNKNLPFKNYRILDRKAWELDKYEIGYTADQAKDESVVNEEKQKTMFTNESNTGNNIAKNTILYGPPGTGKTYNTIVYAVAIIENKPLEDIEKENYSHIISRYNQYKKEGLIEFTTFHQAYGYEEFIEGIRPVMDTETENLKYRIYSGSFKSFCKRAAGQTIKNNSVSNISSLTPGTIRPEKKQNYVFIIDEINRGNISKIFGELITLIEESKRIGKDEEMSVRLPYSRTMFGVPENVYLIGTMNTADRSIATLDTALRRRFDFVEMLPNTKLFEGLIVEGISIKEMLDRMNKKIEVLYDREHTLGHAYFIPLLFNPTIGELKRIFQKKIIPLLQEYFFEDYEKIRLVLNDNNKENEGLQFIKAYSEEYGKLFGKTDFEFDDSVRYEINEDAFDNIEAYKQIYSR